jgi:methionyl-tRNA synthetase
VAEENYFFRLSAYQAQVEDLLQSGRLEVVPQTRRNEVLSFVRRGLTDISISRSARRMGGWGVPVPGDDSQVIYVWIDALANYISGLGFGGRDDWQHWWSPNVEKVHVIGKNVWKFHAVYWPALLLSAELPLPDRIVVHGFVTAEGRKIGKSLGNAIDPFGCINAYGADAVRYYLLRAIPPFDDGDFSPHRLRGLHNSDLANGLGNLVSRLARLCERAEYSLYRGPKPAPAKEDFHIALEACEFDKSLVALWRIIEDLNRQIETVRPWELLAGNDRSRLRIHLGQWLADLHRLTYWLSPFLPATAEKINQQLFQGPIRSAPPLFPRQ